MLDRVRRKGNYLLFLIHTSNNSFISARTNAICLVFVPLSRGEHLATLLELDWSHLATRNGLAVCDLLLLLEKLEQRGGDALMMMMAYLQPRNETIP